MRGASLASTTMSSAPRGPFAFTKRLSRYLRQVEGPPKKSNPHRPDPFRFRRLVGDDLPRRPHFALRAVVARLVGEFEVRRGDWFAVAARVHLGVENARR